MRKNYGTLVRIPSPAQAEEAFLSAKRIGFSYCQIVYKPEKYRQEDAATILSAAEEAGMELTAFFAGYPDSHTKWNLSSDYLDAGINSKSYGEERMAYVRSAAGFVSSLGLKDLIIHAGFVANNPFSEEYRDMLMRVREVASFCQEEGLNLLLETGGESPITLRRLLEDCTDLGNVFANLDTGNLILYGYGNPVDAIPTLAPYLRSVHLKDGLPPTDPALLGKEVPIGEGYVDFRRFFLGLESIGFQGPLIIEREIEGEEQKKDLARSILYLDGQRR